MRSRLSAFPWSKYRTQIVVAVIAVTAIVLVFHGVPGRHLAPRPGMNSAATGLGFATGIGARSPSTTAPPSAARRRTATPRTAGTPRTAHKPTRTVITPWTTATPPSGAKPRTAGMPRTAATSSEASAPAGTSPTAPVPVDPELFAPGACVAYPPVNGNRGITVFLDAGHGGKDPGGVGETLHWHTVTEAWVNLRVEMDAMTMLTQQGYRVVVSRTGSGLVHPIGPEDSYEGMLTPRGVRDDIAARDICANMGGASLLVGIYMNAGYWGGGSVTAYCSDRSFGASNKRFAGLLEQDVLHELNSHGYGIPNLGLQTDDRMGSSSSSAADSYGHLMLLGPAKSGYFTTPSRMPGALIEPLFLTDPFEASLSASSRGQSLIAAGITHAVINYFE
jgi:N-acetylmuramoyl-L-alanine amidase